LSGCPMKKLIALFAFGVYGVASGCVHEPTPVERALVRVARERCVDPRLTLDEARVVRETTVVDAEPVTFVAWSTRQQGGHVVGGTKLFVNAPQGMGAGEMARILACHGARALLGEVDPAMLAGDPFYLPDGWIDSEVTEEDGLLVVKLSAETTWQNLIVLHRAVAFANAHPPATAPY
jgi:hypothetical protein